MPEAVRERIWHVDAGRGNGYRDYRQSGKLGTGHGYRHTHPLFFCPDCGSRVYHQGSASPDILTIKGGSLDDASGLRPAGHIWVSRKQPWVMIDGDVPQHPTQPKDFQVWGNGGMA
jgi:hypothetical protein